MRVIPVIDILDGQVVRGIAGQRAKYLPIKSRLTSSTDPLEVARALRSAFELDHFYVADLDGILNQRPNLAIFQRLIKDRFELIVDAGVRNTSDATILQIAGVKQIIVALETCRSPDDLAMITATKLDITFSLDLLTGIPQQRKDSTGWSNKTHVIVRQALQANVNAILPLDLTDVGMETGGSTDSLCRFIRNEFPKIRLITGGGIRGVDDLKRIRSLGVDDALIASALHDGRITPDEMRSFRKQTEPS